LSIGLALPVARGVEQALELHLGDWPAFSLGILAAGVVGGLVALVVSWLAKPRGGDHPERSAAD
jgi:hypothetical protein